LELSGEAHTGYRPLLAVAAHTAKMGSTAIQFGEVVTFLLIKGMLLPVDSIVVDVAGIRRLVENQPFKGFSLMLTERKFVAHSSESQWAVGPIPQVFTTDTVYSFFFYSL
jgi:hypothetical protein